MIMNTRLERLSRWLPADDTAALVTAKHHLQYLTGFPSGDSWLLITREKAYFLTDFRYIEMAKQTVKGAECRMITRLSDTLRELAVYHGLRQIVVEAAETTVPFLERLREPLEGVAVDTSADLDAWLSEMRAVKESHEVEKILQAQALTEEVLDEFCMLCYNILILTRIRTKKGRRLFL